MRTPDRRLGWVALAVAVAAATILVPPMVAPNSQDHRAQSAPAPSLSSSAPSGPSSSPDLSSSPNLSSSPGPSATPAPAATRSPTPLASSAVSRSKSATTAFRPIKLQAADPRNVRSGARIIPCRSCDGGSRVGYIGGPNTLIMLIRGVSAPGKRTLALTYETDAARTLKIRVNDSPVRTLVLAGASDLLIPAVTKLSITLPSGATSIKFFNDAGSAPDINGIVIS